MWIEKENPPKGKGSKRAQACNTKNPSCFLKTINQTPLTKATKFYLPDYIQIHLIQPRIKNKKITIKLVIITTSGLVKINP